MENGLINGGALPLSQIFALTVNDYLDRSLFSATMPRMAARFKIHSG